MDALPLELQMMTIEHLKDFESLVALFDALPSTDATIRNLLLYRIFDALQDDRNVHVRVLRECRDAVLELRDLLGMESKVLRFKLITDSIDEELARQERPLDFRGLTHPRQGQTMLKKARMKSHQKITSRRAMENTGHCSPDNASLPKLWLTKDGKISLEVFKDNLYRQQLT